MQTRAEANLAGLIMPSAAYFRRSTAKIMQTRADNANEGRSKPCRFCYAECCLFSPFFGKDNANEGRSKPCRFCYAECCLFSLLCSKDNANEGRGNPCRFGYAECSLFSPFFGKDNANEEGSKSGHRNFSSKVRYCANPCGRIPLYMTVQGELNGLSLASGAKGAGEKRKRQFPFLAAYNKSDRLSRVGQTKLEIYQKQERG